MMACPTCDHTMHRLSGGEAWCPRCGTLRSRIDDERCHDEMTMLVLRCREFSTTLGPSWKGLWHKMGIEESIHPPGRSI